KIPLPKLRVTRALLGLALLSPAAAVAQQAELSISEAETRDPPTLSRLHSIGEAEAASGWAPLALPLRTAALQAFQQERFIAADAWFHLFEWGALFAEPENRFVSGW